MIDIQFIPDDWERVDTWIGVFHDEEDIIRIGCSAWGIWDYFVREGYVIDQFKQYRNAHELILGTVEEAITHETMHIILKRWFGVDVSVMLDNVDTGGGISNNRL